MIASTRLIASPLLIPGRKPEVYDAAVRASAIRFP